MLNRSHEFPAKITRQGYWLAAAVPLLLPLGWALRDLPGMDPLFAWLSLLVLYVALPLVDLALGRDLQNPAPDKRSDYTDMLIPVCASLMYFAVLVWALATLATHPERLSGWALLGWTVSLANMGGVVAINVAHELIHKRERWLQNLGGLLLSSVAYACFKIEHPRWHHVKVATPEDPSSAPVGSNVYLRAPRAWLLNTRCAWLMAQQSAAAAGRPLPAINHEMTFWYALSAVFLVGTWLLWGPLAAAVWLAHGLGAALLLEVINYVEHYGLRREQRADGRYEPPRTHHSWDSDYWLSNALLLQLPRHADHHVNPSRPFAALQRQPPAPQLPFGYSTAVLVALLPPVWHAIMNNRVRLLGAPPPKGTKSPAGRQDKQPI